MAQRLHFHVAIPRVQIDPGNIEVFAEFFDEVALRGDDALLVLQFLPQLGQSFALLRGRDIDSVLRVDRANLVRNRRRE